MEGIERVLNGARTSAQRAAALTQRLLAFSRRQTLDPKPTDVNRLVQGMEDLIHRTVGTALKVEVVGAAGLWTTLVDQAQLESSLLNLRWSRLLGQVGGEVKLIPDVIMPPVWSSDHGGHAPHDLKHRSVHRPLPGFAPLDPSAVAACCSR